MEVELDEEVIDMSQYRRARDEQEVPPEEELLRLCLKGTVSQLEKVLPHLSTVYDADGNNALMMACRRPKRGVQIVQLLLKHRTCSLRHMNNFGATALHWACRFSIQSNDIVTMLLDADQMFISQPVFNPQSTTWHGFTPLMMACIRSHYEVVTTLVHRGAKLESKTESGETVFLVACQYSSVSIVDFLIQSGANVHVSVDTQGNALHYCCSNDAFKHEIMALLLKVGVDPNLKPLGGHTAFQMALTHSAHLSKIFLPYGVTTDRLIRSKVDPIGILSVQNKALLGQISFFRDVNLSIDPVSCWSTLRSGGPICLDNGHSDCFRALSICKDIRVWILASTELPHQHPVTGNTMFHLLCESSDGLSMPDKLRVANDLMRFYRNPFTTNFSGNTCSSQRTSNSSER